MNDDFTRDLVAAWRAANEDRKRLQRRLPLILALMTLLGAVAVVLLPLEHSDTIPGVLLIASLATGADHLMRVIRASVDRNEAWQTLTDEARLRRISPEQLVNDIENGTASDGSDR
jgi:hypothetical protein